MLQSTHIYKVWFHRQKFIYIYINSCIRLTAPEISWKTAIQIHNSPAYTATVWIATTVCSIWRCCASPNVFRLPSITQINWKSCSQRQENDRSTCQRCLKSVIWSPGRSKSKDCGGSLTCAILPNINVLGQVIGILESENWKVGQGMLTFVAKI